MDGVMGRARNVSVILLIGSIVAGLGGRARSAPEGVVRTDGHAVADARGPFNALGATLFWGAWAYEFDRARLERNLAALGDAGVDYIRVLGSVGGRTWEDRPVDPRSQNYEAVIAGLTDLAYDRYGMRVQWTLFGGSPFTPPGEARSALVDRFARLAKGREHKIFAFEIANEARSTGFSGPEGIAELRRLGARLGRQTAVLVALSDPAAGAECETYAGADTDVATMHYPRSFGDEGPFKPLRRPWSYPADYDANCRGELPRVVFNNEPIGPESSVSQDDDASRIAAAYALTFLANNAAYVLHTGPGIRGGGTSDRARGRHANFYDLPSFRSIATALRAARQYLPAGLANWTRHESNSKAAPVLLAGSGRVYVSTSGPRFVAVVLGMGEPVTLRARTAASMAIRDAMTGRVRQSLDVRAGGKLAIDASAPVIVVGRSKHP
jgi:hypothetical protein